MFLSFEIFYFKNGRNRVFLPIHRLFFQSENTKCRIFELNWLIRCQTQEKSQKGVGLASYDTLSGW
jgi:hypothetical protein